MSIEYQLADIGYCIGEGQFSKAYFEDKKVRYLPHHWRCWRTHACDISKVLLAFYQRVRGKTTYIAPATVIGTIEGFPLVEMPFYRPIGKGHIWYPVLSLLESYPIPDAIARYRLEGKVVPPEIKVILEGMEEEFLSITEFAWEYGIDIGCEDVVPCNMGFQELKDIVCFDPFVVEVHGIELLEMLNKFIEGGFDELQRVLDTPSA